MHTAKTRLIPMAHRIALSDCACTQSSIMLIEAGYRAQRYRCPLLFPEATGQTCEHEQFKKGPGCKKDINDEAGGRARLLMDRTHPLYHAVYTQRTTCERINSQAKELGIERPKVRNARSVKNLNTLTYIIINVRALERAKSINK